MTPEKTFYLTGHKILLSERKFFYRFPPRILIEVFGYMHTNLRWELNYLLRFFEVCDADECFSCMQCP